MELIWVMSHAGQMAPKENPADGRIGETPEPVQLTRYYNRLIKDGSLIRLSGDLVQALQNKEEKKEKAGRK